jgi:hypothetical protein
MYIGKTGEDGLMNKTLIEVRYELMHGSMRAATYNIAHVGIWYLSCTCHNRSNRDCGQWRSADEGEHWSIVDRGGTDLTIP